MREVVRVARLRGDESRKLARDRLPQNDAARCTSEGNERRICARPMAAIDRGAVLRRKVEGVEDVLHADGKPAQRPLAGGLRERSLVGQKSPRLHGALALGDALEAALQERLRVELAALDPGRSRFRSQTSGLD